MTSGRRHRVMVALDFQNLGVSAGNVEAMDTRIMTEVRRVAPSTNHELFRAYCRPDQQAAVAELERLDWRTQSNRDDLDGSIIQQCRSYCGQDPDATILFICSKDGDFVDLVAEMRDWGVQVYVMGPRDSSQRLVQAAGSGWIRW